MLAQGRFSEVLRFGIVGVTATLVHFTVLTLAVERLGAIPALANGSAFIVAVCVTYLGQSLWVFRGHAGRSSAQLMRFAVSLLIGFVANVSVMAMTTQLLGLSYQIGFLLSCVAVPVLSFFINKFWVFRSIPE